MNPTIANDRITKGRGPSMPIRDRLLAYSAERDGCRIWLRQIDREGYGKLKVDGRPRAAHRASYEAFNGPIPPGAVIRHTCHEQDTECPGGPGCAHRQCINPLHLRLADRPASPRSKVGGQPHHNAIPLADRILSRVAAGLNGCWIWTGDLSQSGYGSLVTGARTSAKRHYAHRLSYETFVGPIPVGLVIDHLCRTPRCVRPDHLEPVTSQENVLRSPITVAFRWASRTHCEHGHKFTPENTIRKKRRDNPEKTVRACRTCIREGSRARRAAAKGGAR